MSVTVTVVLDSEPLSLLTPQRRHDPARRVLMAQLDEADVIVTPSIVRVEAGVPRDARHADVNRLVADAERLPPWSARASEVADHAIRARTLTEPGPSPVDAVVAATASLVTAGVVEVLTSDVSDLTALTAAIDGDARIVRIG